MTTTVFKNPEKVGTQEVIETFRNHLIKDFEKSFKKSEIDELVDLAAKNPTDKFVVTDYPDVEVMQGDILIWSNLTDEFKEIRPTITDLKQTDRLVLQDNDSMTGDHRLVLLPETKYSLKTGKFVPPILKGKNSWGDRFYDCKVLEINKPFLVFHREHGNLTMPAGEYVICSSMDSQTLDKMMD